MAANPDSVPKRRSGSHQSAEAPEAMRQAIPSGATIGAASRSSDKPTPTEALIHHEARPRRSMLSRSRNLHGVSLRSRVRVPWEPQSTPPREVPVKVRGTEGPTAGKPPPAAIASPPRRENDAPREPAGFLENGGTIETAAGIAAHESTRTTQLYDRKSDALSLDEIERIRI